MGWTRRLDLDYDPNPTWVPDQDPDYRVHILHKPPKAPAGATQFWQVVKQTVIKVDKKCVKTVKVKWIADIVNIGDRAEIPDLLTYDDKDEKDKFCLIIEDCEMTVGFDDGKPAGGWSSEEITEKLQKEMLGRMQSQEKYTTTYAWRSDDPECKKCTEKDPFGLDPGEDALRVEGVGEFLPEHLKKKKEEEKKGDKQEPPKGEKK
jgi:hypothetical protein